MPPQPTSIPVHVLKDRRPLSPMQAIAHWLVEDPDGPRLSQTDAAEVLDITQRQVSTHLRRAHDRQETP